MLVFGTQSPIWPSFQAGGFQAKGDFSDSESRKLNRFNPPWLVNTEIGKTFVTTEQIIGNLSWSGLPLTKSADPELRFGFHEAGQKIRHKFGPASDSSRQSHVLRPDTINWSWSQLRDGTLQCRMHEVRMRIDAPKIMPGEGRVLDGDNLLNDGQARHDTYADYLTREYDRLAACWPVFERQRHLVGLLYAIHELRKRGFQPGSTLNEGIRANEHALVYKVKPIIAQGRIREA